MAKRRARGTGSLYPEKGRGWRGEVQRDGYREVVRGRTKSDCERELAQACSDLEAGRTRVKIRTVGDVLSHYEGSMLNAGRTSSNTPAAGQTIDLHRWALRRWSEVLGNRSVSTFTTRDVDDALGRLLRQDGRPLGERSANQLLTTLRLAFKEAVRAGLLGSNPASLARLPAGLTQPRERLVLSPSQIRVAVSAALLDSCDARVAFCLLLGLRPGEAAGLCWDAVDLRSGILHVRRTRRDEGPEIVVNKTKTRNSRRTLAIPHPLQEFLRERRLELLAEGRPPKGDDLIFTRDGSVCTRSSDRVTIRRLMMATGLPRITMHDCRRSYATAQAEAGVAPYHLAAALGDSLETVFRVYVSRDTREGLRPLIDLAAGEEGQELLTENPLTYNG